MLTALHTERTQEHACRAVVSRWGTLTSGSRL